MILKSFGCSFVFGTDLPDDGRDKPWSIPSKLTYPAHLARYLDMNYVCYARPGIGNLRIMERALTHVASDNQGFFVINWTWIDRFDYSSVNDNRTWTELKNDPGIKDPWFTLRPGEDTQEAKFYYKNLHSQYRDKLSTLMCIKMTIDALLDKRLPFIMTYMDDLIFESNMHTSPATVAMQSYIQPYLRKFQGLSFLEYSRKHNFAISDTLHPLEDAHKSAADLIYSDLGSYVVGDLSKELL